MRYLASNPNPNFCQQTGAMFVRRMKQFYREPRMWILLASPFITILLSFLMLSGLIPGKNDGGDPDFKKALTLIITNMFAFFVLLGFALCSGLYIIQPVQDRQLKLRTMLHFVGMKSTSYFLGSFLADMILFSMPTIGFILLLFPLDVRYFIINGAWAVLLAVMLSFGFALVNLTYLFSFVFKSHNNAFKQIGVIYLIAGSILPGFIGGIFMGAAGVDTYRVYRYAFLIDPFWNFSDAMNFVMVTNFIKDQNMSPAEYEQYREQIENLFLCGPKLAISVNLALGVLFFVFSVLIDSKRNNNYRYPDLKKAAWFPRYLEPDSDVVAEAQAVATENQVDPYSVKVKQLHKVYGNGYPAVGGVSFGMKKSEVIGLLGPNGAGKSTTFSVLTMELSKSYGDVRMDGVNLEDFDCQVYGKKLGLAA